ncbi:serine/threonine-protein kinase HipA [Mariprofundus ferrinatatus]|uniref:Serine/threonine-protein kinase HipA n=1 Tax=Mariprofundus ferrinatatus TaxID=1921087 RepID=A0A2K8L6V6_9PROT|nr:type II toxin-antitoxin system HipA family toxin [Mariprofundus ferrinatatus]ATX81989.1 serine/threonine-protein kinase HipA [Mariprofundus ferrinatatus]
MERALYKVRLTGESGSTLEVGDLVSTGEVCAFRYANTYRKLSSSFAIDPINLPTQKNSHETNKVLFGVFEDSLPDGWGRALMGRALNLSHAQQSPHLLLQYLDHKAIGAISYERLEGNHPEERYQESINSIDELVQAATAFERGELQDSAMLQRLFRSAGSSGGAHPKVNVIGEDESLKIVKFSSVRDIYDVVGLEAACLDLARMAGMKVPEFKVLELSKTKVLCLDRFDRTEDGCRHMISMQSLLNVTGYYHSSYVQMADVIRTVSRVPADDLQALFKQMIFNAVIGNTDDHLKNFSLYYRDGYCLTPAYDLLPDVNQRATHTLSFCNNDVGPYRSEATGNLAARFKMATSTAEKIVDEVVEIVATNWPGVCSNYGVPADQIQYFNSYIERQRKKLEK